MPAVGSFVVYDIFVAVLSERLKKKKRQSNDKKQTDNQKKTKVNKF